MRLSKQRFYLIFHQVRHPLRVISTLLVRCATWDRYWTWISSVRGCEEITSNASPLRRAMLLYIVWNRHIERYADLRFRTEVTSTRDVCRWAGFNITMCESAGGTDGVVEPRPWGGQQAEAEARDQAETGVSRRLLTKKTDTEQDTLEEEIDTEIGEESQEEQHEKEESLDPALHVTWADLYTESLELTNEIKIMCIEYGYPLDPDLLPQSIETRKYSA